MKKSDDGYVLIYVLVVLVLLALLALTVCAISLRNFQVQQSAVSDMQERYAAEGIMEQVEAGIQSINISGDGQKSTAHTAFENKLKQLCDTLPVSLSGHSWEGDNCTITAQVYTGTVSVLAQMDIRLDIAVTSTEIPSEEPEGEPEIRYSYALSVKEISYLSYDISTVENSEEDAA